VRNAQEWNFEERDTDRDRENEGAGEGAVESCGIGWIIREEEYSGRWRRLFTISMYVETSTRDMRITAITICLCQRRNDGLSFLGLL
jgi:hypothetical protein